MSAGRVALYAALLLGGTLTLLPFFWMLSTSLKSSSEVFAYPPVWLPAEPRWSNYGHVLRELPFGRYLANTAFVATTVTLLEVLTSSLAGYAFARIEFPGRDRVFLVYLATLMVPGQVTVIPNFLLVSFFGWSNTYLALIVPAAFSAFGTFLLRQFFLAIPREIEQAARIDGCGSLGVYRHVVLPLSGPAVGSLTIFVFMAQWNAFLWPLIVANSPSMRTLTVGLSFFRDEAATQFNYLMAGTVMNVLPVLVVYVLLQRYFVRGIALTGIAGR